MFDDLVRAGLLAIAGAYAKATRTSLSAVSRKFYGKASFLTDLKTKRQSISVRTVSRILDQFRDEWPEGVARPNIPAIFMGRQLRK